MVAAISCHETFRPKLQVYAMLCTTSCRYHEVGRVSCLLTHLQRKLWAYSTLHGFQGGCPASPRRNTLYGSNSSRGSAGSWTSIPIMSCNHFFLLQYACHLPGHNLNTFFPSGIQMKHHSSRGGCCDKLQQNTQAEATSVCYALHHYLQISRGW
jgi:hypothetical protein